MSAEPRGAPNHSCERNRPRPGALWHLVRGEHSVRAWCEEGGLMRALVVGELWPERDQPALAFQTWAYFDREVNSDGRFLSRGVT